MWFSLDPKIYRSRERQTQRWVGLYELERERERRKRVGKKGIVNSIGLGVAERKG